MSRRKRFHHILSNIGVVTVAVVPVTILDAQKTTLNRGYLMRSMIFGQGCDQRLLAIVIACFFVFVSPIPVSGQVESSALAPQEKRKQTANEDVSEEAWEIHRSGMLFDGHNDLPWAMRMGAGSSFDRVDIANPTDFHTDIPRLKKGGLKAQFWSVFVPASSDRNGLALLQTLEQIQLVHDMCDRYPDVFEMADTADDVERICEAGKIASMIGVEGGHSIQNSLQVLRLLYEKGARYMTLTHSQTLAWADSATDDPKNNGLSPFGKEVVREMNRLGMLVDLSHVSDKCMADAFDIVKAPVIYSHSSARAICDHPRNVPDEMLKRTAENGGVVMVNFMSGYIVPTKTLESNKNARGDINTVCDHIDHIVEIAGIDHVGIGSDYDGVRTLPVGLDDVSCYPKITQELLNRGYNKEKIHKILGGNILRVLRQAEQVAVDMKNEPRQRVVEKKLFDLKIEAGEFDRNNVVVRTLIEIENEDLEIVTLSDADGNSMIGQLGMPSLSSSPTREGIRELEFILPSLDKGESVLLTATDKGLNSHVEFDWHDDKYGSSELRYGDQAVVKYMYEPIDTSTDERRGETYKVYHHVFTPDGSRLMTKGPGGLFPHHRGIFFGYNSISYGDGKSADVWHCKNGASQSHEASTMQVSGPVYGRDVNVIYWRGQDGQPFAKETREITSYKMGGGTLIEFDSILKTLVGPIRLAGDPQHAGVQFRSSQDVPDHTKHLTFYIRPDGKAKPGEFRNWSKKKDETDVNKSHINLKWNAVCISLPFETEVDGVTKPENRQFTVCYLDHPANPKPSRYSERDYARFGSYFEYELTPEAPLRVRYRFWIENGEMTVEEIDAISDSFVSPVQVRQR